MREDDYLAIADALKDIAEGSFAMKEGSSLKKFQEPLEGELQTRTTGKGKILCFGVYPGIQVSFHQYLADKVQFHHKAIHSILEVSHCRKGRIGWNMRNHISVYLGAGDLCLRTMDCCADSEMSLPLGYYEGLSFSLDLKVLQNDCPQIVREANIDIQRLHQKFCEKGTPVAIPSSNIIEGIFDVLYELSPTLLLPYYKLKAQELLLYLSQWEPSEGKEVIPYASQQTELMKEIHDFLVEHLEHRFTIEEISKKYLINTSSLKSAFKAVYGYPIATYMKEFRIRQAMKLLQTTNDSIAVISEKVGYENQGKFTKAFKETVGILPTEYRKANIKSER